VRFPFVTPSELRSVVEQFGVSGVDAPHIRQVLYAAVKAQEALKVCTPISTFGCIWTFAAPAAVTTHPHTHTHIYVFIRLYIYCCNNPGGYVSRHRALRIVLADRCNSCPGHPTRTSLCSPSPPPTPCPHVEPPPVGTMPMGGGAHQPFPSYWLPFVQGTHGIIRGK
jgi:hypothetical protein